MLKQLTITFENDDSLIIPADAIHYLGIENITQNVAFFDQTTMYYQKAECVELSIYEDAITNLKTAYMQDNPKIFYKESTMSDRLTYPAIQTIQLDNNEPINVPWAPVKTVKDEIENRYQISEKSKDIENRPLISITITDPNNDKYIF